jgi:hypothetical protein
MPWLAGGASLAAGRDLGASLVRRDATAGGGSHALDRLVPAARAPRHRVRFAPDSFAARPSEAAPARCARAHARALRGLGVWRAAAPLGSGTIVRSRAPHAPGRRSGRSGSAPAGRGRRGARGASSRGAGAHGHRTLAPAGAAAFGDGGSSGGRSSHRARARAEPCAPWRSVAGVGPRAGGSALLVPSAGRALRARIRPGL